MKSKICLCCFFSMLVLGLLTMQANAATKSKKIDLNSATQAELEGLKGVGPALAKKIMAARPFNSIDDLKSVSGIGQATFDDLKDLVTVKAVKAAAATEAKSGTKAKKEAKEGEEGEESKLINLNTADKKTLEGLAGVGSAMATKIIAARPFKSIKDLTKIKGFSQKKFDAIKDLVTVEKPKAKIKGEETKATKAPASSGPIDLNSADQAALEGLPGIGPVLAGEIIAARPFKSIDDLKNVKGISQTKLNALKDLVTVNQEDDAADVNPKLNPGQTININTASEDQLTRLLGIGPVKAKAIIAARPYSKIEDIMKVKGIKEKTFAKIKDYIVVR